jgi:hypothetical protein
VTRFAGLIVGDETRTLSYSRRILEDIERAKTALQGSMTVEPLMMYCTKSAVAAFDPCNNEELVTLTYGGSNTLRM